MAQILMAEDDALIGEIVSLRLQEIGHTVSLVDNGKLVMAAALQIHPDLIILDNLMPGRRGIEVLADLKKRNSTAEIPVIMLSAQITPNYIKEAKNEGAVEYITKPFNPESFLLRIASFLEPSKNYVPSTSWSF